MMTFHPSRPFKAALILSAVISISTVIYEVCDNAEVDQEHYDLVKSAAIMQPDLQPMILKSLEDDKLTMREFRPILDQIEANNRHVQIDEIRDTIKGKTNDQKQ